MALLKAFWVQVGPQDHQYQATLQVGQHVGSEDTEEEPTSTSTSASPDKDHHEHRRANLQLGELVADEHTLVGEPPLKSTNSQAEKHYFGCDPRILDSKPLMHLREATSVSTTQNADCPPHQPHHQHQHATSQEARCVGFKHTVADSQKSTDSPADINFGSDPRIL
ncbi:unnamed protein product [Mesocestoides corti]|uniref:Uncharacterized protein n=1 Tax=Mesocestoides corti TaxID=53468 RepID=A0A0R3UHF3_MESCO|nr:unnamed protein product [Mesocestoides corti]